MGRWICPYCDREFGRTRQAHVCLPGSTVDDTFAGRPPVQREICAQVVDYLASLGEVHLDAVRVGVFIKTDRTVVELRPKARSLELWLNLRRTIDHPRIARAVAASPGRICNLVKLTAMSDVDDEVREWLTEAYDQATDE
jgi:hypothetical protein